jgi:hypothetical protein
MKVAKLDVRKGEIISFPFFQRKIAKVFFQETFLSNRTMARKEVKGVLIAECDLKK